MAGGDPVTTSSPAADPKPGGIRRRIISIGTLLVIGAMIGGVLGAIFIGDWVYTVVWGVGLALVLIVVPFLGPKNTRRLGPAEPQRIPGIINSRLGQNAPAEAVLNPPSSAVPATGATLNGVPMEPGSAAPRPAATAARRSGCGIPILVILLGIVLTLIPSYRLIGWTVGDMAQGRWDARDMRTSLHQQEAVDDLARYIGGYDFVAVSFYGDYVIVEAPTRPGATTTDSYQWQYGRATRMGPRSGSIEGLFDASRVDFSIVGDLVAQAKADTGWSDFTYFYPSVREGSEGRIEISISLGNDYHSASYRYTAEGEFIDKSGSGLD